MSLSPTFALTFLTPDQVVLEDVPLTWGLLPGEEGDVKIFPGHTPLLLLLRQGTVQLHLEEGMRSFEVSGGFANILPHRIILWTPGLRVTQ